MATGTDTYKVTIEDINKVTEQLGPDELKLLYDNLGIDNVKVEHAEASSGTTDTILKAREVLRWWRRSKGSGATREALFGERDKILARRTDQSEARIATFNLKECQDQLQELYLGSDMKVRLTPWDPDHAVEMDAIFVNLELEKDEVSASQTKQIPLERNEDLLTLKTSKGRRVNRVLIQGEPGSGKSTLLNNIAYKWALQLENTDSSQSHDLSLSQFDLVFIINIHEIVDKNDSLEDIIFDQILEESQTVSKNSLKSYLKSNSERCLFLIDAVDEDSVGILTSKTNKDTAPDMSRLLYNKLFKQSCVIASLRPYKLQDMGQNQRHFTKVKLTGFSDENIEVYLRKYFKGNKADYTDVLQRLKEEEDVWGLAGTPLLLLFFCVLWSDQMQAQKSLPNTRTKLYQETIESLWKRYHYEMEGVSEEDFATDEFHSKMMNFLGTLGIVTIEGLINQSEEKVLFTGNDFDKTTLSLALRVGLLSKEKIRSKQHRTFVKFVHTSFQDFCSAVYLANLLIKNNDKCKEYITKLLCAPQTPWLTRTHEVLYFCAGCKPETAKLIAHQLIADKDNVRTLTYPPENRPSKDFTYFSISMLSKLAYEAQLTHVQCNELISILTSAGSLFNYDWYSYHSLKPIQYQLDLIKSVPDTTNGLLFSTISAILLFNPIEFTECYPLVVSMLRFTKQMCLIQLKFKFSNPSNQVYDLFELFDVLAHLTDLTNLILLIDPQTPGRVHVSNIHKICHIKLEQLHLIYLTINVESMTEFINQNTTLKSLVLVSNPYDIYTQDTFSMIKAMSKHKNCLQIELQAITIGRAVKHFELIISQLTVFTLFNPSLDEWDVYNLVSYLHKAEKLNQLGFGGVTFGSAICRLADQLKCMVNLRELELLDCGLGNHESHILAVGIKKMRSLCKLDLRGNPNIGMEGRQTIENLRIHPQFKELEIKLPTTSETFSHEILDLDLPEIRKFKPEFLAEYNDTELRTMFKRNFERDLKLQQIQKLHTPSLPDCCRCMSQIYNGVTCMMSFMKSSSKVKDGEASLGEGADSTTTSSMKYKDEEKYLAGTSADTTPSPLMELGTSSSQTSVTCKLKSPSDESKSPRNQLKHHCFNPICPKRDTEIPGGLKKCTRCKTAIYCSRDCQRKHWKIHRSTCNKHQPPL